MTLQELGDVQLSIRDMAGRLAFTTTVRDAVGLWTTGIDLTGLSGGMYLLELQGSDWHLLRKFVKE